MFCYRTFTLRPPDDLPEREEAPEPKPIQVLFGPQQLQHLLGSTAKYLVLFWCIVEFLTRLDRGAGNFYVMKVDPKMIEEINKAHEDNLKACMFWIVLSGLSYWIEMNKPCQ